MRITKDFKEFTAGGGNGKPPRLDPDGKYRGQPLFKDNCVVYTGTIVVGGIVIKENTIIKVGSVVHEDIL